MTAAQNDSNGYILPQLRLKRPIPARGVLSPPRATRQAQDVPRLSESVAGFPVARLAETFLYFWTVVAIILGIVQACFVLYMLYLKEGGNFTPSLPFNLAAFGGLAITLASCFGLFGLLHHRKIVTEGRRNYSLGMFIILGTIGASVVVVAGAMALSLVHVVQRAQDEDFSSDQVVVLETNVITRLHAQVLKSSSAWRNTQNELKCCGYDRVSVLQDYLSASSSWDASLQTAVEDANAIGGRYCSTRVSECVGTTTEAHCPVPGRDYCRVELLQVAQDNYSLIGICALTLGATQLLFSAFGLFTLLCDVRRISGSSPIYEIRHQMLSPVQPNVPNAEA
ncbi:hypothetical protein Pcac1_g21411 [Phytophthora cactorum]|uniref:Tetraspanin/Peripherin n=1 Tax=Phytophthora cactorum TaxID=29920 RepID=A0A329S396_9STRA|nr:hypothetical protein Pcac1_g21411 [Phytophthora cactorum]RAW31414.1 hypothetical protein PC110_g12252 [Phytophthora cactorum]